MQERSYYVSYAAVLFIHLRTTALQKGRPTTENARFLGTTKVTDTSRSNTWLMPEARLEEAQPSGTPKCHGRPRPFLHLLCRQVFFVTTCASNQMQTFPKFCPSTNVLYGPTPGRTLRHARYWFCATRGPSLLRRECRRRPHPRSASELIFHTKFSNYSWKLRMSTLLVEISASTFLKLAT